MDKTSIPTPSGRPTIQKRRRRAGPPAPRGDENGDPHLSGAVGPVGHSPAQGRAGRVAAVVAADRGRDRIAAAERSSCSSPARQGAQGRAPRRPGAGAQGRLLARPRRRRGGLARGGLRLDKKKKHTLDAVVDRLIAKEGNEQRLHDSVETALRYGQGVVVWPPRASPRRSCSSTAPATTAASPSRSRRRSCSRSTRPRDVPGVLRLGTRMEMDPDLVVPTRPDDQRRRGQAPGRSAEGTGWGTDLVRAVARERGIDLNKPWRVLPPPTAR